MSRREMGRPACSVGSFGGMDGGRLLVVQHEDGCPVEWFGEWLAAGGLTLDVLPAHRGSPVPTSMEGYVGLLVLGGEMGANDDDDYDWLAPTRALIATTVEAGRPFLGICLGHQLAAVALGGEVERNPRGRASGLTAITPTALGRRDPLLGVVEPGVLAVQWNDDVVTRLPAGATVLAWAPDGTVSAARYGRRAWGVQFHPEVSPRVFRGWARHAPTDAPRQQIDPLAAAALVDAAEAELRKAWAPLAARFAVLVRQPLPVP